MDYLAGGPGVQSFETIRQRRALRVHSLQPGYMHVSTTGPDNTIVGQPFDGRSPRNPEPDGKASPEEIAQAFSLDDVHFDAIEKLCGSRSGPGSSAEDAAMGNRRASARYGGPSQRGAKLLRALVEAELETRSGTRGALWGRQA